MEISKCRDSDKSFSSVSDGYSQVYIPYVVNLFIVSNLEYWEFEVSKWRDSDNSF